MIREAGCCADLNFEGEQMPTTGFGANVSSGSSYGLVLSCCCGVSFNDRLLLLILH